MTRAAATAYAISLAREHLGDYVPTADVTLTNSRERAPNAATLTPYAARMIGSSSAVNCVSPDSIRLTRDNSQLSLSEIDVAVSPASSRWSRSHGPIHESGRGRGGRRFFRAMVD